MKTQMKGGQKNMKTTKIMGIIALAFVLLVPLVFAEEIVGNSENGSDVKCNPICDSIGTKSEGWYDSCSGKLIKWDNCNKEENEIEEENETISDGEMLKERISLFFTWNQEKRAEKELKLADMELIRARIALKNNNTKAMEKALESHDRLIEKVQNKVKNKNEESDKTGIEKSAEWLSGIEKAVDAHEAKIERLNQLIANDTNLSEDQIENINARIEKSQSSITHLKEVESNKQERIKVKLMAVNNLSEEEADERIEELKDSENLSGLNKNLEEKQRNRREEKIQFYEDEEETEIEEEIDLED
jgi:hypothetical protein